METITIKKEAVHKALVSLHKAIDHYEKASALNTCSTMCQEVFHDKAELVRTTRDSMIQRFEYSIDILWKYVKTHLEQVEKVTLDVKSPRNAFKALCNARLLSEPETELALEMLDARNTTSHMYKEEQAELLAAKITSYYGLMMHIKQKIAC